MGVSLFGRPQHRADVRACLTQKNHCRESPNIVSLRPQTADQIGEYRIQPIGLFGLSRVSRSAASPYGASL